MNVVSYFNPVTHERDNDGELGLLTETITEGVRFFPIDSDEFDIWVNGYHGIKSFALHIDNGTCTFSKEFRKSGDRIKPYWYAAKRVNGKLKKLYFGTVFTKDNLNQIVDKLQENKVTQEVTQEVTQINDFSIGDKVIYANPDEPYKQARGVGTVVSVTETHLYIKWQDMPKMQAPFTKQCRDKLVLAAGNGKSDRHIQPSLMELANDPVKILTHKNKELERQNKELNKRLIALQERNQKLEKELEEMQDRLRKRDTLLDTLEDKNENLNRTIDALTQERNIALTDLKNSQSEVDMVEEISAGQQMKIDSLEHTVKMQAALIKSLQNDVFNLECESSKREDDVAGYAFMYEEHSNKIFDYQTTIEKYRQLALGKTKKDNPRFAYLIDFLAEIDKLS